MQWMKSFLNRSCCASMTAGQNSLKIALLGNPNSGKTTLFNALTGSCQKVGNWPGVTVERKSGFFSCCENVVEVVDLPGTYALNSVSENGSLDERIACEFILNRQADAIINVIDANNIERNLYLTMQLIEMRIPVIVAVNMLDVAEKRGIQLDLIALEKQLGCPVIGVKAHEGFGVNDLKQAILQKKFTLPHPVEFTQPLLNNAIKTIASLLQNNTAAEWLAIRLLENDITLQKQMSDAMLLQVSDFQKSLHDQLNEDADILFAEERYHRIEHWLKDIQQQKPQPKTSWTKRIDNIVLNRFLGIPLFLFVMYSMFFFAINVGGAFQDFFDMGSHTLFVDGFANLLQQLHFPNWLIALLAEGVGKGISTTITFIPVIGAMFFFLALLEDSGYMARAAFVVDRLMQFLGLPGKSFVPMIVGFGCNVPSVLATRTLENQRDRILTVMMSPFMSCSARLAIFAVFTAAFFKQGGHYIVFTLYLIGILMAMLTGFALRKTILKGKPAPLVMELPPYHVPQLKTVLFHAWQRLKSFVFRAGKLIVPICMLIGMLNAINWDGTLNTGEADSHSILSVLGRTITPIFAPMGIDADNWPATVGLVTGVLAKEVVIGTLNALYSQTSHLIALPADFHFWANLKDAVLSIPLNFSQLIHSFGNPILAKAPIHELSQQSYGAMYQHFDGRIGAMAYLLFVLLYFPCVSTVAAMARELNRKWALFSVLWTTTVAYSVAVGFYQLAIFAMHPGSSLLWIVSLIAVLCCMVGSVNFIAGFKPKWESA